MGKRKDSLIGEENVWGEGEKEVMQSQSVITSHSRRMPNNAHLGGQHPYSILPAPGFIAGHETI